MYIIALNGSPNENGNTAYLLNKILSLCENEGAKTEAISVSNAVLSAKKPFCDVCSNPCNMSCFKNTELENAYIKLSKADAVIIGSPVYFGSVTAQLKAFFDKSRKYRGTKSFVNIPVCAVTVGGSRYGGQETTIKAIHDMALVQGMTIFGDGHSDYDAGHHGVCAVRPSNEDDFANKRAEITAKRAVDMAKMFEDFKNINDEI